MVMTSENVIRETVTYAGVIRDDTSRLITYLKKQPGYEPWMIPSLSSGYMLWPGSMVCRRKGHWSMEFTYKDREEDTWTAEVDLQGACELDLVSAKEILGRFYREPVISIT